MIIHEKVTKEKP